MNRRNFLNSLIGGVATTAAVRTFPFRVFSFPSTPRLVSLSEQYRIGALNRLRGFDWYFDKEVPVLMVPRESVVAEQMYQYFVKSQIEAINARSR